MKIELKEIEPCRQQLKVAAPAEETSETYAEIVTQFAAAGRIPGFRKGKAPIAVVEKKFKTQIDEEIRSVLVPKLYHEALKEKGLTPVAVVSVENVNFSSEAGLSFDATVDVAPDFKLPKYKKISVKAESTDVSDSDVDEAVEQMRTAYATYDDVTDKPVEDGNVVQIDYSGTIDGEPVSALASDCDGLGEGTDFWAQCGDNEFLPGISKELVGISVGDEKDINIKFPKDFRVEAVKGRKAAYHVAVKAIKSRKLPELDEEFCKRMACDNAEALTKQIREHLEKRAQDTEASRRREEISTFLLKKVDFDMPKSIVEHERQLTVSNMVRQFMDRGASREQLQQQQAEILQQAEQLSADRVKLGYILNRIADEEKITVDDDLFKKRAEEVAVQNRMSSAEFLAELEKNHGTERLMSDIRSELTMDFLLEEAKVK